MSDSLNGVFRSIVPAIIADVDDGEGITDRNGELTFYSYDERLVFTIFDPNGECSRVAIRVNVKQLEAAIRAQSMIAR